MTFVNRCQDAILRTFDQAGCPRPSFRTEEAVTIGEFERDGRLLTLEISSHDVVMYEGTFLKGKRCASGSDLFEAYLRSELENDETHISGFTRRLARFLRGGPWSESDEGPISRLLSRISQVRKGSR